ncbi:NAD(P)/FAD-dependent oxidoreductase [Micromonospora olivasterospora]|uniref:NAD/ferredoxin-dependent reductase-like protein n=1 Tax=Micromonospora olivasterospora TaxID=1880 RepID=A0A562I2M6_MICOL|nr:FAD-dependent oxidoreductase [Micromonospora olivasterospora]TWH65297.1 NAD/ferredoxin-dependent reductase-like protein [Micromonospora olivasterospora]
MTVLIVGASVAGVRTAQALRMAGYSDAITVVGDERHVPYDKPPLSKEMIERDGAPDVVPLVQKAELASLDLDLRLGSAAVSLDAASRLVTLADGAQIPFDRLVIATGVRPRTLPGIGDLAGVHTIRSVDDAAALRSALGRRPRVVVIGAGFIGAEFASAAVGHGVDVSIVEAQPVPLAHVLGADVGRELARLHGANGVRLETGVGFERFVGDGHVTGVRLTDGRVLPADLVVVGIGAVPNTEWLTSSGLPVNDGVVCDEDLQVAGWTGIYAAGDVALRQHPLYGTRLRIEHWTNANEHASIVAASITGGEPPRPQAPYVWSDQYGRRIQIVGRPAAGSVALTRGSVDSDTYVAVYADDGGLVVGAVALDDPRTLMRCRKAVTGRHQVEALTAALVPTAL